MMLAFSGVPNRVKKRSTSDCDERYSMMVLDVLVAPAQKKGSEAVISSMYRPLATCAAHVQEGHWRGVCMERAHAGGFEVSARLRSLLGNGMHNAMQNFCAASSRGHDNSQSLWMDAFPPAHVLTLLTVSHRKTHG
eukprot:75814-Chlamydomonas_euryale.AAC.1